MGTAKPGGQGWRLFFAASLKGSLVDGFLNGENTPGAQALNNNPVGCIRVRWVAGRLFGSLQKTGHPAPFRQRELSAGGTKNY